jgi:ketosteroid isomerase-like protein
MSQGESQATAEAMLKQVYDAFNRRDIGAVLAVMHPDVEWPNGMDGGYVHGHGGVREYWTRQWGMIDPSVTPTGFAEEQDGRIAVKVRQVIRNLSGEMIADREVEHVYRFRDGLVDHMEIRTP